MRLSLIATCVLGLSLFCSTANAVVVFTCTRSFNQPVVGGYLVAGNCAATGTATATGDPLEAVAPTLVGTSTIICGSAFRILVDVIFGGFGVPAGGANTGFLPVWDSTNLKVMLYSAPAAINTAFSINAVAFTGTANMRFIAICK